MNNETKLKQLIRDRDILNERTRLLNKEIETSKDINQMNIFDVID